MDVLVRETWSGATAFWHELPRTLTAGALVLAASAPLAAALVSAAPGWMSAVALLPLTLALTAVASFAAPIARGDQASSSALRRIDPVLALLLSVAGLALIAPWGVVPAAAVVIVGPYALAYGAVRGKRGLAAVRGGAILAAYRPSWALTSTALTVLAGFAAVASAGVLALVAAPLLLTLAARQTANLLAEIDARQVAVPPPDPALPWGPPSTTNSGEVSGSSTAALWTGANCGQPSDVRRNGVSA
ncbi:hypothetical protein [Paractinoplanes brasiliensis]|uniref:Uncharacterized protein n=1 Tax=Paractinoplanes brasiliensis TaxID=52695 RepID=A0A4R6JLD4_9ACTN|nr:hypothetical protein [Actinoplanes brasiliensis]TDO37153.1 hypothetical protein C8E87_0757 [Actinoplanes brasiliensis]GID32933.1 hypothetical protein Abr02nite_79160 [Actinoplanes brasiliensis]